MDGFLSSFGITTMLITILGGVVIGFPTGPARFFVVDTCLNEGRTAALRVYSGLFCAILIYAGLALLADDLISRHKKIESYSYFIASLLIMFWGGFIVFKSRKENQSSIKFNFGSWFVKGFSAGLSNPIIPFIYLAFIRLLNFYSQNVSLLEKSLFVLVFESFSFFTTFVVALILMKRRKKVLSVWRVVKIFMGVILICLGAYNAYQQLDLSDGIRIKQPESLLEEKTNNNTGG